MEHYVVLTISSVVIAALTGILWVRTKSISFPAGILFMYYWSLYGGWGIVNDRLSGNKGEPFGYLEEKLFPINLDDHYFWSLILYALFIIVVEIVLLLSLKSVRNGQSKPAEPVPISHRTVLLLAALAGIASYFIISSSLLEAWTSGVSGYSITRFSDSPLYTIHQLLNRCAFLSLGFGFAVLCSGKSPRWLMGIRTPWVSLAYLVVLAGMFWFNLVIGDKHELFIAGIAAILFYLANAREARLVSLTVVGVIGMVALRLIDLLRAVPLEDFDIPLSTLEIDEWIDLLSFLTSYIETYAAHFSMYGALAYNIPPTYGSSLLSLAASIVPRILWPNRPVDIYVYYAESVRATVGQGYTIHHATGWYLNFGLLGVILGAILLGWIWAQCYNSSIRVRRNQPRWLYVFSVLVPAAFVSYIPSLMRAGPEMYKGLIVEGFLLSTVVLIVAAYRWRVVPSCKLRSGSTVSEPNGSLWST